MNCIVHLCVNEKFIPGLIKFTRDNIHSHEHIYIVTGKPVYNIPQATGIYQTNSAVGRLKLNGLLYKADKIFLHGLYDAKYLYLLAIQPWLLKKCYWFVWGNDLYQFQETRIRFKNKAKEAVRRFVIPRIGNLVSCCPGELSLVKQWYGGNAIEHNCLSYESNIAEKFGTPTDPTGRPLAILLGNSAYPRNNHKEAIDHLTSFLEKKDFVVYTPLSYGPPEYANEISAYGYSKLGNRFVPIMEFMPPEKYTEFLAQIDIAYFNNHQQQGFGNLISLFALAKTVFIHEKNNTIAHLFRDLGLTFSDSINFKPEAIGEDALNKNTYIIKRVFSRSNLITQYNCICANKK